MTMNAYDKIRYAIIKPDGRARVKIEQIVKYPDYDTDDLIHECYLDWVDNPYDLNILVVRKEVYKKLKRMLYHLKGRLDTEMLDENFCPPAENKYVAEAGGYFTTIEWLVLKGRLTRTEAARLLNETYDTFRRRLHRKLKRFRNNNNL